MPGIPNVVLAFCPGQPQGGVTTWCVISTGPHLAPGFLFSDPQMSLAQPSIVVR
jgi:hypothetical protein